MTKLYLAGDILSDAAQWSMERIEKIVDEYNEKYGVYDTHEGIDYYSPRKNMSINDKKAQTVESNADLAERITQADCEQLFNADAIIFNYQPHALGTILEMGYVLGLEHYAESHYQASQNSVYTDFDGTIKGVSRAKEYFFIWDDIRRTDLPEVGDRRSLGINQLHYGAILQLTNGKGFSTLEELPAWLKQLQP